MLLFDDTLSTEEVLALAKITAIPAVMLLILSARKFTPDAELEAVVGLVPETWPKAGREDGEGPSDGAESLVLRAPIAVPFSPGLLVGWCASSVSLARLSMSEACAITGIRKRKSFRRSSDSAPRRRPLPPAALILRSANSPDFRFRQASVPRSSCGRL